MMSSESSEERIETSGDRRQINPEQIPLYLRIFKHHRTPDFDIRQQFEALRTLYRTLSFSALVFRRGQAPEPRKVLWQSSYRVALAHCSIHIAPAIVSISLVVVNLIGYFVGSELEGPKNYDNTKMGFLQVAAKVQELLVVGSFGSIIFNILRSELVFGEGVPLGLLVSGWRFSQPQYLWSAEFVAGVRCDKFMSNKERWKRRAISLFVIVGATFALLAGPAAALLMIPRTMNWHVGGGIYWLNGSDEQLWPTSLNARYYSDANCSHTAQFLDSRCPAAGFPSLHRHFSIWGRQLRSAFSFEVQDSNIRKTIYSRPALHPYANTWAYTSHAATAVLEDAMSALHTLALKYLISHHPDNPPYPKHLSWADPVRFEVETKVPAVRVLCRPQGVLWLWGKNLTVEVPSMAERDASWEHTWNPRWKRPFHEPKWKSIDTLKSIQENLAGRGILRNDSSLLEDKIFQQGRRTLIIPIENNSTGNSLDLVLLLSTTWGQERPSNVISCSVDARWTKAKTFTESKFNYQVSHDFETGCIRELVGTDSDSLEEDLGYSQYTPPTDGSWPKIHLSSDWYNMLSPTLPREPRDGLPWLSNLGSNQTALEVLVDMNFDSNKTHAPELENVIAISIVDGLSRSGLIPNFNASRFLEGWSFGNWTVETEELARTLVRRGGARESFREPTILKPNLTRMVMVATYQGYVMAATGWFDYLSMTALILHALLAFIHCTLVLHHRTTSGAWDSILELLVLAHNSAPPSEGHLSNTSVGVASFKTVKLLASVENPDRVGPGASVSSLQPMGDLQLRLRAPGELRDPLLKPTGIGDSYGSVSR